LPCITFINLYPLSALSYHEAYTTKTVLDNFANDYHKIKNWANNCQENFLAYSLLVEAETAKVTGDNWQASQLYDEAIQSAKDNELLPTEALVRELGSQVLWSFGKAELAETYMTKAHFCYSRWGATRKVKDLEEKYPQLLLTVAASSPQPLVLKR
jgi:hypothetical protein